MLRPQEHLVKAGKLFPYAWKAADRFREQRGKGGLPSWPGWCYLPMVGWYAILSGGGTLGLDRIADVGRLAALGSWRVTQGIYRFDPDIYQAVSTTPLSGDLPAEVLYRLPEWCVYIETPGMQQGKLYGCFFHLEWDGNTGRTELRFLLDRDDGLFPFPVHLGPWSLEEALLKVDAEAKKQGANFDLPVSNFVENLSPLVSLLLYLCTQAADYGGDRRPSNPAKGSRLFPPPAPRVWEVGSRIGAALRKAYQEESERSGIGNRIDPTTGGRASPRPHIRRAHWHAYRVGAGKKETLLHWLPPIPINIEDPSGLPAVVRPVS